MDTFVIWFVFVIWYSLSASSHQLPLLLSNEPMETVQVQFESVRGNKEKRESTFNYLAPGIIKHSSRLQRARLIVPAFIIFVREGAPSDFNPGNG